MHERATQTLVQKQKPRAGCRPGKSCGGAGYLGSAACGCIFQACLLHRSGLVHMGKPKELVVVITPEPPGDTVIVTAAVSILP